jgi:hypothetical protein
MGLHGYHRGIFQHRWFIGFIVLIVCIFFEIHGSSIGKYSLLLQSPKIDLFGHFRSIRSDEWLVSTPFAFSQYFNDFRVTTDIIRGMSTDLTMVYSQVC